MANRDWILSDASWNRIGVTLTDTRLEWWETGQGSAGGAWSEQSFADFMTRGPAMEDVPPEVAAEIAEAVRTLLARYAAGETP